MVIWMCVNFLMPIVVPNIAWQAHLAGFLIGGLLTMFVMTGVRALRLRPVLVRTSIYGGALLIILVAVSFACNQFNPLAMMASLMY